MIIQIVTNKGETSISLVGEYNQGAKVIHESMINGECRYDDKAWKEQQVLVAWVTPTKEIVMPFLTIEQDMFYQGLAGLIVDQLGGI